MLLNRFEYGLMNNPVRSAIQRHFEARRLLRLGGRMEGGRALEIGCGRGVGTEVILDVFGADEVDAFDLDPRMVALTHRLLRQRAEKTRAWVGDAAAIAAPASSYDAVFDFGIIHHVPHWRDALREVYRVLRPGGRFYAEEIFSSFILNPVVRRLLDHPENDRFDGGQFLEGLRAAGFEILDSDATRRWFGWFTARKVAHPR